MAEVKQQAPKYPHTGPSYGMDQYGSWRECKVCGTVINDETRKQNCDLQQALAENK